MSKISKVLARLLAVLALAAVALAIVMIISSSLEESGGDKDDSPRAERRQENDRGERNDRERRGKPRFYIVQPGDSLSLIAEKTGVSLERLQELNPDIDPQLLASGARLRLR